MADSQEEMVTRSVEEEIKQLVRCDGYEQAVESKRIQLLGELKVIEDEIKKLAKQEKEERKQLCNKYGHYYVTTRNEYLCDTGRHSFSRGSYSMYRISQSCTCCGHSTTDVVTLSTADLFAKSTRSDEKTNALEELEKKYRKPYGELNEKRRKIKDFLDKLCSAFIDRKLQRAGFSYDPLFGYEDLYFKGTEYDAEVIRKSWYKMPEEEK